MIVSDIIINLLQRNKEQLDEPMFFVGNKKELKQCASQEDIFATREISQLRSSEKINIYYVKKRRIGVVSDAFVINYFEKLTARPAETATPEVPEDTDNLTMKECKDLIDTASATLRKLELDKKKKEEIKK